MIRFFSPSYTGTTCVTPSPESSTTPVVRPEAYRDRIALWGRGREGGREGVFVGGCVCVRERERERETRRVCISVCVYVCVCDNRDTTHDKRKKKIMIREE